MKIRCIGTVVATGAAAFVLTTGTAFASTPGDVGHHQGRPGATGDSGYVAPGGDPAYAADPAYPGRSTTGPATGLTTGPSGAESPIQDPSTALDQAASGAGPVIASPGAAVSGAVPEAVTPTQAVAGALGGL